MLGWMRRNRKKKNYITNIKKEKILGVLGFLIGPQRKQTRRYRQNSIVNINFRHKYVNFI